MRRVYWLGLSFIGLIGIFYLTNPSREAHQQRVEAALAEAAGADGDPLDGEWLGFPAIWMRGPAGMNRQYIYRDNYGLFSITEMENPVTHRRHAVGVGIAGHVFIGNGIRMLLDDGPEDEIDL